MMVLLLGENRVYPYTIGRLRADNPNTSFPKALSNDLLATFNVFPVKPTEQPIYDPMTQNLSEGVPTLQSGEWVQVWTLTDASAEEIAQRQADRAEQVRAERNTKLAESDWTQVLDAPVDRDAWALYRQALRDLTSQPGFPWVVEWPGVPQ